MDKEFYDKIKLLTGIDYTNKKLDQRKKMCKIIRYAVPGIFGSLIIATLAYIIENFNSCWLNGFIFIFVTFILINVLASYFMAIFNKFEPLKDTILQEKIEKLLSSVGLKSSGVFSLDALKRDNILNAYFGGLDALKRVVLFNTLISHPVYIFFFYLHPPLVERLKHSGYNGTGIGQIKEDNALKGDYNIEQ